MVGPRRVDVVDALIDGVADLNRGALLVDPAVFHRKAHAAESQDGQFVPVFGHLAVKHHDVTSLLNELQTLPQ